MQAIAWSGQLKVLAARMGCAWAVTDASDQSLSYTKLSSRAHDMAQGLLAKGLKAGQTIGVWLPNSLDAVCCAYGIRLMGGAETPLSWTLTESEFKWCCTLAQIDTVITRADREEQVRACGLRPLRIEEVESLSPSFKALPPVPAATTGRVLFTSGTAGKPKAVRYTHGARWIGEQMLKASFPFIPEEGEKLLLMTPFVHGASLLTFAWCDLGGHVLLHDGVFAEKIEPLLAQGNLSAIFAPPTVLAKITQLFAGHKFEGVRCIFTGTQAMTEALYQATHEMFGPVVRITYGKSECVNPITVLSPAQTHEYFSQPSRPAGACVGWPVPGVSLRIAAASEDASEMQGEVFLRAPQQCADLLSADGVINHHPQGWHATGDLGFIDESGRLILTGRVADVIKTGGYKVNPDEIEATLSGGTLYGALCVTALASEYWGEVIVAVAQDTLEGWEMEAKQRLQDLSKHKQPRLFVAVSTLERNPQGKINRKQVAKSLLKIYEMVDGPHPYLQAIKN